MLTCEAHMVFFAWTRTSHKTSPIFIWADEEKGGTTETSKIREGLRWNRTESTSFEVLRNTSLRPRITALSLVYLLSSIRKAPQTLQTIASMPGHFNTKRFHNIIHWIMKVYIKYIGCCGYFSLKYLITNVIVRSTHGHHLSSAFFLTALYFLLKEPFIYSSWIRLYLYFTKTS